MVRGRRRKRTKYTWMPTLGGESDDGDTNKYGTTFFGASLAAQEAAVGPTDLYVTPIVPDATFFPFEGAVDVQQETLRDFTEGQDWLLKRIVGRLCVSAVNQGGTQVQTPTFLIIGAGFFVGRANDNNQAIPDSTDVEIDPLNSQNVRQPWIWRRTWILRNQLVTDSPFSGPPDNMLRCGNAEGPVIDSKVARRIRREERLWFVINGYGGNNPSGGAPGGGWSNPGEYNFNLDYRILGAMRRSNNRSTF